MATDGITVTDAVADTPPGPAVIVARSTRPVPSTVAIEVWPLLHVAVKAAMPLECGSRISAVICTAADGLIVTVAGRAGSVSGVGGAVALPPS